MNRGLRVKLATALAAASLVFGLGGCSHSDSGTKADENSSSTASTDTKLGPIEAFIPPVLAFGAPMIDFGKEGNLKPYSDNVTVKTWSGVNELKVALINNQVQVAATPAYTAANLYNKGVDIKFVGTVVWGMIYGIGQDGSPLEDWNALKGKRVGVAWPGQMFDLVFRYVAKKKGLVKNKDYTYVPVQEPQQLVAMLIQGKVDYAILPEHLATVAMMKAKKQGKTLVRALNMQKAWADVNGGEPKFPMAGLVVSGKLYKKNPKIAEAIRAEVAATVKKLNAGDPATIKAVAKKYKLPEKLVADVIPRLQLNVVPAQDVRKQYEGFLQKLGEIDPQIYGGKLPDANFYAK